MTLREGGLPPPPQKSESLERVQQIARWNINKMEKERKITALRLVKHLRLTQRHLKQFPTTP